MMDVALAIEALLPAAEYGGSTAENTQEAYDALRWEDSRPKPTWSQIEVAWVEIEPSLRPRRRKEFEVLNAEIKALNPTQQERLTRAIVTEFLAERPQFANEKLGIDIEGDELES